MKAREWVLASYPVVTTEPSNFALVERELPEVGEGEVLVRTGLIGFAPSLRFRMTAGGAGLPGMKLGETFTASGVGLVLESRSKRLAPGDYVYGDLGWRDCGVYGSEVYLQPIGKQGAPLTNTRCVIGEASEASGPFRLEDYLGLLGGVGMAAHIGLLYIGGAKAREKVVVTAAGGGIGVIACQLARWRGLTVHGTTRDAEKAKWLEESVGVDRVIVGEALPDGEYDLVFDNVGGTLLNRLVPRVRKKSGRFVLCGLISEYETDRVERLPLAGLVFRDLTLRGFFADDYLELWPKALDEMGRLLTEGHLSRHYEIVDGLENAPQGYLRLYRGTTNRGKLMLRVGEI
jgi:NADPH-dependent curcumin reductase CurA